MPRNVFVDTGVWVAIGDRHDRHHTEAVATYMHLANDRCSFTTTNLVVAEAHALILHRAGRLQALRLLDAVHQAGRLSRVYADAALEAEAEAILRRYADHHFSLTDAVSFAIMRQRGIAEAFTFDKHFATAGFTLLPGAVE